MNAPELGVRERILYAGLAVMLTCLWLAGLAGRPLFNPDEGRYAEIPREMLTSGDWIIPHLNGLAYAEKPPLQYWATAFCYRVFGINEFAARLYEALCALGTIVLVGLMARASSGERAGWRAASILASMLLFAALGHLLTLDMSLTFYLTLSLMGFLTAQRGLEVEAPRRTSRNWMLLAWGATALGVMSKGIVAAAIPAATLLCYSIWTRSFSFWRRLHVAAGLPLFLIITVPWHWLAARRDGDFLNFYFVHEHVARYLTPVAQRVEPWWFFVFVLLAGSVPWTASMLRIVAAGWRREGNLWHAPAFLWTWVMFVMVFFSASDSKLMPYILPVMPPLALLIAASPPLALQRDFKMAAIVTLLVGIALGAASTRWAQLLSASSRAEYFLPLSSAAVRIAALLSITGAFVLLHCARLSAASRELRVTRAAVFLGVGWCLTWMILNAAAVSIAPIYSGVTLAASIPPDGRAAPIYSIDTYDQTLDFYLRRTVILVHFRGELDYGLSKNPAAAIADLETFQPLWAAAPPAFALLESSTFEQLQRRGVPMRIIGRSADRLMTARR